HAREQPVRSPHSSTAFTGAGRRCHAPPAFFFNDPAPPEIYTLSLHDALPISRLYQFSIQSQSIPSARPANPHAQQRSEEHTSELQSLNNLVCRPLRGIK